ncbi:transposase, partial [Haloferax sp. Atlit-6N]
RYQELAEPLGLDRVPGESVLSRTWRKRFDDGVREFVRIAAHFVVKEIHDRDISAPSVRPKSEVVDEENRTTEDDEASGREFTDEQIYRTTRLARDHGFGGFDSGRAANATYEDTQFFELQTFMGMVGCGTPQGATRFQYRHGADGSPHGDTHLRAVKQ